MQEAGAPIPVEHGPTGLCRVTQGLYSLQGLTETLHSTWSYKNSTGYDMDSRGPTETLQCPTGLLHRLSANHALYILIMTSNSYY